MERTPPSPTPYGAHLGIEIVETGDAEELYRNPKETYTQELLEAVPKGDLESLRERFGN